MGFKLRVEANFFALVAAMGRSYRWCFIALHCNWMDSPLAEASMRHGGILG
jgi:hypothetical protein